MKKLPTVYTIIVTYNGQNYIERCLTQLLQSDLTVHIVVVDNCSIDETVRIIRTNFPSITVITLDHNQGFGAANNIGLKYAHGHKADFILLLNQDVYVEKDAISILVQRAMIHKDYGILSPMHLNGTGQKLDRNFQMFISSLTEFWSDAYLDARNMKEVYPCKFINAAAWLLPASCVALVGGFDPLFFHYGEDRDFTNRVAFNNLRIGVCPQARIFHDRNDRNNLYNQSVLAVEYMFALIHLKNVNRTVVDLLIELCANTLRHLLFSLLQLRFGQIQLILKLLCKIAFNARKIYLHRNISRRRMPFLDT